MAENKEQKGFSTSLFGRAVKITQFGLSGIIGCLFNLLLLFVFRRVFSLYYFIAGIIAIEAAIALVFFLNDRWTWRYIDQGRYFVRFFKYNISSLPAALFINYPVFLILVYLFGIHYLLASFVGFLIAGVVNFIINHRWTWGFRQSKKGSWVKTIGWVILGIIVVVITSGYLLLNETKVQKFVISKVIEAYSLPLEVDFERLSFSFGSIFITRLDMRYENIYIKADSIASSIPVIATRQFDSVYIGKLVFSIVDDGLEDEDDDEMAGAIKIPIGIKKLVVDDARLNIQGFEMNDLSLSGQLKKDGIRLDTLGVDLVGRGRIVNLVGDIDFDDKRPALAWDADIEIVKSRFKSNGSLLISPLTFDFRAWGDSIHLAEVDSLIDMEVLYGFGNVDIYLNGSPQDTLVMDIKFHGDLFDIYFDNAQTKLTFLDKEERLVFEDMSGRVMNTTISGKGEIFTGFEPPRYTVDVSFFNLNLEDIVEDSDLETSLTGHVVGSGIGFEPEEMDLRLTGYLKKSSFWGFDFDSADASIRITIDSTFFEPLMVIYRDDNIVELAGYIAYEGNMALTANCRLNNIANVLEEVELHEMIGGRGRCKLEFYGQTINPSIQGNFFIDSLFAEIFIADSMSGDFELTNIAEDVAGVIDIESKGKIFDMPIDSLISRIYIDGNIARISSIEVYKDDIQLWGSSDVEFTDDSIVVAINHATILYDELDFNLIEQTKLYFVDDKIYSDTLAISFFDGIIRMNRFFMDSTIMELNGDFSGILAEDIMEYFEIDFPLTAGFVGNFEFTMPGDDIADAHAVCYLRTDYLTVNETPWESGYGSIEFSDGVINIPDFRIYKQDEFYTINGFVKPLEDPIEMDLWLEGTAFSTNLIQAFSDQIDTANAMFDLKLRILGDVENPRLNGIIELKNGYLKFFELEQPIDSFYLLARLQDDRILIDSLYGMMRVKRTARQRGVLGAVVNAVGRLWEKVFGSRRRQSGYFLAKGEVLLEDMSNPFLDIDFKSNYLPLNLHNQGIYLIVDSDISIAGPLSKPMVLSDSIRIIEGTIRGIDAAGGGGTGEMPGELSVRVQIPENFRIITNQAEIEVFGNIVVETSQGVPFVQGILYTRGGYYFTFGKTFEIREGSLNFTKVSEIDPELNINAVTRIAEGGESVTINLHIGGNLSNPQLSLSAGPGSSMTHGDLILLLTMHRATGTEFGANGDRDVLDQLEGKGSDILREYQYHEVSRVARDLIGVEHFEIVPMDNQNLWEGGDYQFIVGKHVSPRLYVRYSQGIGSGVANQLGDIQVEYQLTDFLKLIGSRNYFNPERPENYKLELDFRWSF